MYGSNSWLSSVLEDSKLNPCNTTILERHIYFDVSGVTLSLMIIMIALYDVNDDEIMITGETVDCAVGGGHFKTTADKGVTTSR